MRNITTITLKTKPAARGHQAHRSGAGTHQDRRLKRLKTRQAQRFAVYKENA